MHDHPFDHAIALERIDADRYAGRTSDAYWNSISPFGGVTVATILNALQLHPKRLGDPLALTVNFAGAIQKGEFEVRVRPVRTGRTVQHWSFELLQAGEADALITGSAVFAPARATWSDTEARMPEVPPPQGIATAPQPPHIPFLQRYAMRYVDGNPLQACDDSTTCCWLSDLPLRKLDFPSLAALCDALIPRLFVRQGASSPVATVTLSVNFHVDGNELAAQTGCHTFTRARANAFQRGFYDQDALLWSESGRLLASTHQVVWYRK